MAEVSEAIRAYEPATAQQVVDLWRRAIGDRYPLRPDVLHACLEGNPSYRAGDAVVAWEAGRPIGFGYLSMLRENDPETAPYRGRAWLQAVVVDPICRRSGVGRHIVGGLVAVAARAGISMIECGNGFFYLWPGLPADMPDARPFAEALGFTIGEQTWDLRGSVAELTQDAAARVLIDAAGLNLRRAETADRERLLAFIVHEFDGEWWHDIRWFLDRGGEIGDLLLLSTADEEIVGFARLHTPDSRPLGPPLFWMARRPASSGGLGPIGVARDWRGRGLGRALLALALAELRDAGLNDVVIDFTDLLAFYGPLGFTPWMEFVHARGAVEEVLRKVGGTARDSGAGGAS